MSTPSPRSASSSGAMGRARACSSPSNTTVSVRQRRDRWNEPQHRARQAAVHPGAGRRGDAAADRQLGVVAVDGDAEGAQRADHQVGVAAAQRAADRRRPLRRWPARRARARDWSATSSRAPSRWRAPGAVGRGRCLPACPSRLHPALSPLSATMGCMCGRFAVTTDPALLAEKIQAIDESTAVGSGKERRLRRTTTSRRPPRSARWSNGTASPTTSRRGGCGSMRWGLVPPWAKEAADGVPDTKGPLLINARAEKVTTSPAFRNSAKNKRCLVPMDGWYEWRGREGRQDAVLHVRRRRRAAVHGGPVVDVAAEGRAEGQRAAAERHDHHHRRGRSARRDPRPDAADDQRERLGPLAGPRRADRRGAAARPRRPGPDRDPRGVAPGEQRPQQRPRADRAGRARAEQATLL